MDQIEVSYRHGYDFGVGVRSASGSPMGLSIAGTPTTIAEASGGSGGFQMLRVQTTEELESHLGISVDASGGVGLFSASDRFSYAKDCKVQSSSISVLLYCTKQFGFMQIKNPSLGPEAGQLVSDGKVDLFDERFGDCFVRGISTGGQFYGLVRIDAQSKESRQNIENSLAGSYGPFSADVQVKLSEAMKSTRSSAEV